MADITVAAPGLIQGGNDRLALFLKMFAGECITAYEQTSVTKGRHIERNITSGKSAQFPVFGRAEAAFLKAGADLDALRVNIPHAEKIIEIDGLLTSDALIFDLDDAMAHFDVRAEYSKQIGEALAVARDGSVLAEIAKLVVEDKENITGLGKGAILSASLPAASIGETEAMGKALFDQLLKIKSAMSENYVPDTERTVYIRPMALNALVANKDIINKLYGASVTIENGKPPKLLGFDLVETPHLTRGGAAVNAGVIQGAGHVFPAAYKDSCMFLVAHRSTVGTLTLKNLSLEHARRANLQADQIIAKYAMGHGGLRPEAAFMGVITSA
jgi:hypothetical protein